MKNLIKNLFFQIKYGFKGFPIKINEEEFRVDEQLRRWNFSEGEKELTYRQILLYSSEILN